MAFIAGDEIGDGLFSTACHLGDEDGDFVIVRGVGEAVVVAVGEGGEGEAGDGGFLEDTAVHGECDEEGHARSHGE